jgi:glyoxylase-like metal-dependent hydrolase (beta-lactamase superfamily II)
MNVGDIEILPVIDGMIVAHLSGTKPLPDPASDAWREQHDMFRADGRIESTVGAFLVRTGDRVVLVDAGVGQDVPGGYAPPSVDRDDPDDPFVAVLRTQGVAPERMQQVADHFSATEMERGRLPASLAEIGVHPDDVTDVVCTHLHFDHIGWISADGAPFFPNATIRCAAADLDHFLPGVPEETVTSLVYRTPNVGERFEPVLDRIETWDRDQPLLPGLDVRLAPGHTPGSSVVVVTDGAERALLLGDIIHCPLELMDDDFNLLVDHDQELANRVREAYARELEGSGELAAAAHFPGLRFGRLLPGAGRRHWTFAAD